MRDLRVVILSTVLFALLPGCVLPGSSIGHLSIRGSLQSSTGQPLPDREVQFLLPAEYGLGGLDLVFQKPEDFGHQDCSFTVTTNAEGEFSHDLGDHVYHASIWFLPPLGAFPRHPPPPFFLVRVPSFPGEYYAVETYDGQFKVFTTGSSGSEVVPGLRRQALLRSGGAELPLSQANLFELSASYESGSADGKGWTVGVVDLRFPSR